MSACILQRSPEKYMGQFGSDGYLYDFAKRSNYLSQYGAGSDGYLYDFAKRSPEKYLGQHGGSDGYLYDFIKRAGAKDYMGQFGSDGYLYDFAKRAENGEKGE